MAASTAGNRIMRPLKKPAHDEKELNIRLPDIGPLDIRDYKSYMKLSKVIFNEKWSKPQPPSQTASLSDFKILQLLGSGSSGYVTLARHIPSRNHYAMKCIDKKVIVKNSHVENLKIEQLLMRCLNYPFTIYLLYSFKDSHYIYFVLPFVDGGDLHGHLKLLGRCDEDLARFYASQVILGLEYIHFLDFVYRDLKAENILIDHTGYIKISDFGFSKRLKPRLRTYTTCGTPEYMAPEIILNRGYSKAVDWWSAGVFFYELVAGQTPFVAESIVGVYENIVTRRLRMPNHFSTDLRELIDNMLQINLSKRFGNLKNGADDIKTHNWFSTINWMAVLNRKIEAPYKPCRLSPSDTYIPFKLPRAAKGDKYLEEFADF